MPCENEGASIPKLPPQEPTEEIKSSSSREVLSSVEINTERSSSTNHIPDQNNEVCDRSPSVDDIGVTLDYEPPYVINTHEGSLSITEEFNRRSRDREVQNERSDPRSHRRQRRAQQREDVGLVSFFTRHWFGQCTAAFLVGAAFLVIGIVFVATSLPDYVGIMFMLVSISPFYMAISIFRRARRLEALRRQTVNRRNAIRRRRQDERENITQRRGHLPYSEYPPCYENLGFSDTTSVVEAAVESGSRRSSSFSSSSELSFAPPPPYDEAWKEEDVREMTPCRD